MRPKSLVLLILALGCGLVASIGINQVLANRNTEPAPVPTGDTTPIYVALGEIGRGEPLKVESLKLQPWPSNQVPEGALVELSQVEGRRARTVFYPGEPILEAKLLPKGDSGATPTDFIPRGKRVVAVKVDAVSGGSSLIRPGDNVDVLVHLQQSAGRDIPRTMTRTFLQNVKVFAVDATYDVQNDGENSVVAKTISLLVDPDQAEMVTLASNLGSLRLVMRSAEDDGDEPTDGAEPDELLKTVLNGGVAPNDPPAALGDNNELLSLLNQQRKDMAADEPVEEPSFRMLVWAGSEAREVEFPAGARVGRTVSTDSGGGAVDNGGDLLGNGLDGMDSSDDGSSSPDKPDKSDDVN